MKSIMLTNEQVCNFCMAMEHLVHAGIGTADALTLLKEDEQDPARRALLGQMADAADAGAPLSAVIRQSGAFPTYAATLMEVGEQSGKIEQTLQALARYYEGREKMDRQLRNSFLYPAALLLVLLAVAVVLLVWVLPVFDGVYNRLGSSLTGFSGALLSLGGALRRGLPVILAVLALIGVAFAIGPLRRGIFRWWNRARGDKGARGKVLSARFVHGISMAVSSGMTAQEALALACKLSEGEAEAFQNRCRQCWAAVEQGTVLPQALWETGFLSPADRQLLDAGRRSGKEETVLEQVTERMQEQAQDALERRTAIIEPVVVVAACLLIATILMSVMLPLMNIMNAIG